ncbi:patatin-like phospholipase family protein [Rhizobium leguminosarum]|uniref:patatin-like phospholipase family protein n=1 Tax=Rhizobium leguminosarum TaxID=384 RepID=UPI001440EF01|nr:patatin-like phospholipase family protein [Rhizobium leguminosarum]NKK77697.1 hypothetical protein [Rhizobium leguminosarum bv. viciae]
MGTLDVVNAKEIEGAQAFDWNGNPIEDGVGVALSGGGFRAMLFQAGALVRLNELGLLSKTKRISSVSGDSITAGILAKQGALFEKPDAVGVIQNFQAVFLEQVSCFGRTKLDIFDILLGSVLPFTSAAKQITKSFDEKLFQGMRQRELPDGPEFVFCATNMATGTLWRFTKLYAGGYISSNIANPQFAIVTVVAASAAFPPLLYPLLLDVNGSDFEDWPDPNSQTAEITRFRKSVALCDGGGYDNHGIEPIVKRFVTNFVSDGGATFARFPIEHSMDIRDLKRVLDIEDSQVRSLRRRHSISRFSAGRAYAVHGKFAANQINSGVRFGAYWGVDTAPTEPRPPGALVDQPESDKLARLSTRLWYLGKGERIIDRLGQRSFGPLRSQTLLWTHQTCRSAPQFSRKGTLARDYSA